MDMSNCVQTRINKGCILTIEKSDHFDSISYHDYWYYARLEIYPSSKWYWKLWTRFDPNRLSTCISFACGSIHDDTYIQSDPKFTVFARRPGKCRTMRELVGIVSGRLTTIHGVRYFKKRVLP